MKGEEFQFHVEFITPLLIHGSNSREADSLGLTGKALRGCWRFWFRALVGGMVQGFSHLRLLELENNVFGSADEKTGAKFRLLAFPVYELQVNRIIQTGFDKSFTFSGYDPPSDFDVKILPRPTMTDDEISVLKATIWLWGYLGAIGQRARRGFGSPVIQTPDSEDTFTGIGLHTLSLFESSETLKGYLRLGLKQVWSTYKQWLEKNGETVTGDISTNAAPTAPEEYFKLGSFHQIYFGTSFDDMNDAIRQIHGNSKCDALGYARGQERMASPIFTRLWKVSDRFVPVAVLSSQKGLKAGCPDHADCMANYMGLWKAAAL